MKLSKLLLLIFAASAPELYPQTFDSYGGLIGTSCSVVTAGRMGTVLVGNHWQLCTPAGHVMNGQGVLSAGPQGSFETKYGSSTLAYQSTIDRVKAWGFNYLATYTSVNLMPWQMSTGYKMPAIVVMRPGGYGMAGKSNGQAGTLDQNIKDVFNGLSPYSGTRSNACSLIGSHHAPDWADVSPYSSHARLQSALTFQLVQNGGSDPAGLGPAILANNSLDYVMGVAVEDSDQIFGYWGSTEGYPFDTQPSGMGSPYGGYLTSIVSPIQQADIGHQSLYDTDQTVYVKKAWHDYLLAEYTTISALNTAWGTSSAYTTFGSSATQVTGESVATTDGTAYQYTHTIVHAGTLTPNSIQVLEDGVMVGGDCFHPSFGDSCNPTAGNTWGAVWGAAVSGGEVNYGTGAITISFTGVAHVPGNIVCTAGVSCIAYFNDYDNPGVLAGSHVAVSGSTGGVLDLSNVVVSSSAQGAYTFSGAYCAPNYEPDAYIVTYPWSGGDMTGGACQPNGGKLALINIPDTGHVLTINYSVNGWDAGGTGLMDEDGRPSHYGWMGDDPYFCVVNYSAATCKTWVGDTTSAYSPNAAYVADMQGFMESLSHNYFAAMRATMRAAFTDNGVQPPMFVGPDTLGTWTSTPPLEVMRGAAGEIDIAEFGNDLSYSLTQPMLDAIGANFVGPILDMTFLYANPDSPYASYGGGYATQAARGAGYLSLVNTFLIATDSSGVIPRAGWAWEQYPDSDSEHTNWGLVTALDNAYDGHESVTGSVTCSAPEVAYTCGGEAGNYGDVITSVKSANALWLTSSSPTPGILKCSLCRGRFGGI